MMTRTTSVRVLVMVGGIVLLGGCGRKPEPDFPGNCSLNCSNAIIGSAAEFDITPITKDVDFTCPTAAGTTAAFGRPVRLHFRVLRTVDRLARDSTDKDRPRPVPNISFEPVVYGVLRSEAAGYDQSDADCSAAESSTAVKCGVWTPQDQWCSDSCGTATLEVWPACVGGLVNNITVGLHSGSLFSSDEVNLAVDGSETGS